MATVTRRGPRDVRLDRREGQVLTGIVMSGSTVLRRIGGSRAGEVAAHRFLDHDDVTPEATIAAAAERTRAAASAGLVDVAAEVIDVSDREGDIYQHFARRRDGVEMVVRAHHDRKLAGGGQLFAAAEGFGQGFVREVFVAPRGPGDKGRTAK